MHERNWTSPLLVLVGTGILAGGAVRLGIGVGQRYSGNGGQVGVAASVPGLLVCVGLLAWGWRRSAPGTTALTAAASTAVLSILTTALFIAIAFVPYENLMCDDAGPDDFCGLEVAAVVPTVGAVVPWTVAGLPGLYAVVSARRRRPDA